MNQPPDRTTTPTACPLAATLARRFEEARDELTRHWLDRIVARVTVEPNRVFPTNELLNHVPILIDGIAAYVADPAAVIPADMVVIDKARELGALRHAQGFDQFEILKEFEILGGILLTFAGQVADESPEPCERIELFACAQRVFQAVHLLQAATSTQYLTLLNEKVREREERLRAFNRAITHELRNRIGVALGAAEILTLPNLPQQQLATISQMIAENARDMQLVLDNLLELSRVEIDPRQQRRVRLPQAAAEAVRQLRDMAAAHQVEVRIAPELPDVEVNAAAVELCLTNLISNAIKYANPAVTPRWVEVRGRVTSHATDANSAHGELVVEVADNGVGVPVVDRARLFDRFFRTPGAEESLIAGTGLGLSIVGDTIRSLGGTVWATFPECGSVFAFSLPARRTQDA